jgi:hypothetical protein
MLMVMDNISPDCLSDTRLEDTLVSGFMARDDYEDPEDNGMEGYNNALDSLCRAVACLRGETILSREDSQREFVEEQAKVMYELMKSKGFEVDKPEDLIERGSCGLYDDNYPPAARSTIRRLARAEAYRSYRVSLQLREMQAAVCKGK